MLALDVIGNSGEEITSGDSFKGDRGTHSSRLAE